MTPYISRRIANEHFLHQGFYMFVMRWTFTSTRNCQEILFPFFYHWRGQNIPKHSLLSMKSRECGVSHIFGTWLLHYQDEAKISYQGSEIWLWNNPNICLTPWNSLWLAFLIPSIWSVSVLEQKFHTQVLGFYCLSDNRKLSEEHFVPRLRTVYLH